MTKLFLTLLRFFAIALNVASSAWGFLTQHPISFIVCGVCAVWLMYDTYKDREFYFPSKS